MIRALEEGGKPQHRPDLVIGRGRQLRRLERNKEQESVCRQQHGASAFRRRVERDITSQICDKGTRWGQKKKRRLQTGHFKRAKQASGGEGSEAWEGTAGKDSKRRRLQMIPWGEKGGPELVWG